MKNKPKDTRINRQYNRMILNPATLISEGILDEKDENHLLQALHNIIKLWMDSDSENSLAFELSEIACKAIIIEEGKYNA